jgi:signal transduction histidine kinase
VAERGRTLGVLLARWRQPVAPGDDDLRFLESMANLLATALQRAQSEAALSHAQRLESVGQLTGGIAHDFNNLLTVIHGNLQVLEDLPAVAGDPMAPELVAAAARACRRGADLTGQLLAFSRRQVLQPRPVDLQRMLPALADMLRRTLDRRIVIEVAPEPGCPPCKADPGQLESALLNIAINARDAMPDGGTLRFAARRVTHLPAGVLDSTPAEAAAFVAISLADSGSGMSESVKARAFEPFFTTKEAGRGTGLGLSTVYGFARQSQGGVTLDSAPGMGTTVTLYIPAVDTPAAVRVPASAAAHGVPAGLQVMVVEDEPAVQRVVQAFLQGWGCEVLPFPSAEPALSALSQPEQRVDLLLSDVVLGPGMRGTALAEQARRLRPALPVLLMSGYSSELLASEAAGGPGAPELLRKPFSKAELAQAIARALAAVGAPLTAPSRSPDGPPG